MTDQRTSPTTTSRSRAVGGGSAAQAGPPPSFPISVVLASDAEIVRRGLSSTLASFPERVRVHDLGTDQICRADIVLLDAFGGRRDAIERAAKLLADDRAGRAVLLSWGVPAEVLVASGELDLGGVVDAALAGDALVDALERIASGERVGLDDAAPAAASAAGEDLSAREREVLTLLAEGRSNRQIADELFLSVDTVKTYVRRVFAKLGVNNRTQAALRATGYGLTPRSGRVGGSVRPSVSH